MPSTSGEQDHLSFYFKRHRVWILGVVTGLLGYSYSLLVWHALSTVDRSNLAGVLAAGMDRG